MEISKVVLIAALFFLAVVATAEEIHKLGSAEIVWDTYGVPHIYADSKQALAYGYGYAQGRDHSSTLLRFIGIGRGRAAEYWGESWRTLDVRTISHRVVNFAEKLYNQQIPEGVEAFEAFAQGFSRYLNEHPEDIKEPGLLKVLPISGLDLFKHSLRIYFEFSYSGGYGVSLPDKKADSFKEKYNVNGVHFSAYADHDLEQRPFAAFKDAFGSNGWAINSRRSDSNGAKINMNPHLPYLSFFRWTEAHLIIENEDYDFYGTGFIGIPNLQIGFNKYLGWTHTVNQIQPWTVYKLDIVNERQYYYDNQLLTLQEERFPFKVLLEDGTFLEEVVVIESSVHGDISQRQDGQALAVRLAGIDRPDPVYQWTLMSRAKSFEEFKDAMRILQISMFTTIFASRDGDIMHSFNGFVPKRSEGDWSFWRSPVPGNSSRYLWTELHTWDELPRLENPDSGYVQNCNEPPWIASLPLYQSGVNPANYPAYISGPPSMGYRPQASVRLLESSVNISYAKFVELKHSTLKEYANHVVDELIAAIAIYGNGEIDLQQAARILGNWDRTYDATAAGAQLFDAWTSNVAGPVFVNGWSDQDPLNTPNTLYNPVDAVEAVRSAIRDLRLKGLSLDAGWGENHRFPNGPRPSLTFPGHGASDTFRNVWWGGDNLLGPVGGDSFVCVVEFNPTGIRAGSLIGYGNATPQSRGADVFGHVNDQWELFAAKQLKTVRFARADVDANVEEKVLLTF